jgi:hypothetical protein
LDGSESRCLAGPREGAVRLLDFDMFSTTGPR